MKRELKEKYFTIDSDELVKYLLDNGYIEYLGTGDRYDDKSGLNNDWLKSDNTYNWEIMDEDEDERRFYNLSNNFEIRENDNLLVLSKHLGGDIRGNYGDDKIYLKTGDVEDSFYFLIWNAKDELAKEDKN